MAIYFPSNLRFLRRRKGLKQEELGHNIGKAKSTISLYESGKRTPSIEDINLIAQFFRISPDRLINEDLSIQQDGDVIFEADIIKNKIIKMHISEEEFDLIMSYLAFLESRRSQ